MSAHSGCTLVGLFYYVTCGNCGSLLRGCMCVFVCVCVCVCVYMVDSESSRNHFISEKCKTVQPFKLHFLQNSPLLQLYSSVGYSQVVGGIPESHFMKAFSALPSRSKLCQ